MASKRHIRRKQCGKKRRFTTRGECETAMHLAIKAGLKRGRSFNCYHCSFCGGFHFGHRRSTRS